jgi:hypothetical protein
MVLRGRCNQLLAQGALADAGLADHHRQPADGGYCVAERGMQQAKLSLTSDERTAIERIARLYLRHRAGH